MIILQKVKPNQCPECYGEIMSIEECGDDVCFQCGLVLKEKKVNNTHLRRAYTKEEVDKRRGNEIASQDVPRELNTYIDRRTNTNAELKRAVKRDNNMCWEKRNLLIANTEIKRISFNLGISYSSKKSAIRLYKKARKFNILRGRSIKAMAVACLQIILKNEDSHILLSNLIGESDEKPRTIRNALKHLYYTIETNNITLSNNTIIRNINEKNKAVVLIPKYVGELNLGAEIESLCKRVLQGYISRYNITGKDPKGLCAGCIYFMCKNKGKKRTQKDIAKVCGVTEVTLRSRYQDFNKKVIFNK